MTDEASVIAPDAPHEQILHHMGFDPVDADTLAARCQLDIAAINAHLLSLEMDGRTEMLPGGMHRRIG